MHVRASFTSAIKWITGQSMHMSILALNLCVRAFEYPIFGPSMSKPTNQRMSPTSIIYAWIVMKVTAVTLNWI